MQSWDASAPAHTHLQRWSTENQTKHLRTDTEGSYQCGWKIELWLPRSRIRLPLSKHQGHLHLSYPLHIPHTKNTNKIMTSPTGTSTISPTGTRCYRRIDSSATKSPPGVRATSSVSYRPWLKPCARDWGDGMRLLSSTAHHIPRKDKRKKRSTTWEHTVAGEPACLRRPWF
jgi:hypothetical protein